MKHVFTLIISLFWILLGEATILFGQSETDSLSAVVVSEYQRASSALDAGDYETVEQYLSTLSKKEKASFAAKMLTVGLYLGRMDSESSWKVIKSIPASKIADHKLFDLYEARILRAERMLQSALPIVLIGDPVSTDKVFADQKIGEMAESVGLMTEKSFTPSSARVRWQVTKKEDGRETFSIVYRLGDGTWDETNAEEVTVLGLDSLGRYSYPFLLSDGETLYFTYEGPETLGGRDIYLSRYNAENHTLLVPQQLPVPINSPSDDYAYVKDEATGVAAFLTTRNQPLGQSLIVKYREAGKDSVFPAKRDSVADYLFFRSTTTEANSEIFSDNVGGDARMRPPLFFINEKAVYGQEELMVTASKNMLERYTALMGSYESEKARLAALREVFADSSRSKPSVSSEIIAIEKAQNRRFRELTALRNEIIKSEMRK